MFTEKRFPTKRPAGKNTAPRQYKSYNVKSPLGLEASVRHIKTIGPNRATLLERSYGIRTVRDFLYHFPYRYVDRTMTVKVADLHRWKPGVVKYITVAGRVEDVQCRALRNRDIKMMPFEITISDRTGKFLFTFFRPRYIVESFWMNHFRKGDLVAISARFEMVDGKLKYNDITYDRLFEGGMQFSTGGIIPLYSSTQQLQDKGMWSSNFRMLMRKVIPEYLYLFDEIFPSDILRRNNLILLSQAIQEMHFPISMDSIGRAHARLAFEELFFTELLLGMRKKKSLAIKGIPFKIKRTGFPKKLLSSLPFALTESQENVLREIMEDMKSETPMNRLLQGDVGSGKTVVALYAMLTAVENEYQCAFMAPTEILAEQHYKLLKLWLDELNVEITLLTGSQTQTERAEKLEQIVSGKAQIIVGTHALFQEKVAFAKLGFIVIDEQHRFGVMQRMKLKEKAAGELAPDILLMSATPIPRTLAMTVYGDMDVSTITELPKDRKPVITKIVARDKSKELKEFLVSQIKHGKQIYIVYPLIEESEKSDLRAAVDGYEKMRSETFAELKDRIGLLHGKMTSEQKDAVMEQFKNKKLDILVSTTVIEVGIDIPNATVIVIVNAERFGLAQIHQLRGRVGRGTEQSYCLLRTEDEANQRLIAVVRTNNGFEIAEEDLRLRGPGDFFGTRQSGLPEFRFVNFAEDKVLIEQAREEAFAILEEDPQFIFPEHQKIRLEFERKYKKLLDTSST
ncbi:MAG: ATP-dependent DNA helicase RecG [Bacteroidota bacterium]